LTIKWIKDISNKQVSAFQPTLNGERELDRAKLTWCFWKTHIGFKVNYITKWL